jgi:hypothetical protein
MAPGRKKFLKEAFTKGHGPYPKKGFFWQTRQLRAKEGRTLRRSLEPDSHILSWPGGPGQPPERVMSMRMAGMGNVASEAGNVTRCHVTKSHHSGRPSLWVMSYIPSLQQKVAPLQELLPKKEEKEGNTTS